MTTTKRNTIPRQQLINWLEEVDGNGEKRGCAEAIAWVKITPGSPKHLYDICSDVGWLEWVYTHAGLEEAYRRVEASAREEYQRVTDPALAE